MSGRKLVLADGTEYREGEAGYSEAHLWLYLPSGANMAQAFADFSDAGKTSRITFVFGESSVEYAGYTDFRGITKDGDGKITVHLTRPQREEG